MALKFHRNFKMEGYRSVFRHWILKFFKNFKAIKFQRNFNVNTYRRVSKDHLPEYVSFFEFVENNKKEGWFQLLERIIFSIWHNDKFESPYLTKNQILNLNFHDQSDIATVSFT